MSQAVDTIVPAEVFAASCAPVALVGGFNSGPCWVEWSPRLHNLTCCTIQDDVHVIKHAGRGFSPEPLVNRRRVHLPSRPRLDDVLNKISNAFLSRLAVPCQEPSRLLAEQSSTPWAVCRSLVGSALGPECVAYRVFLKPEEGAPGESNHAPEQVVVDIMGWFHRSSSLSHDSSQLSKLMVEHGGSWILLDALLDAVRSVDGAAQSFMAWPDCARVKDRAVSATVRAELSAKCFGSVQDAVDAVQSSFAQGKKTLHCSGGSECPSIRVTELRALLTPADGVPDDMFRSKSCAPTSPSVGLVTLAEIGHQASGLYVCVGQAFPCACFVPVLCLLCTCFVLCVVCCASRPLPHHGPGEVRC
jgi:hypothetical protein